MDQLVDALIATQREAALLEAAEWFRKFENYGKSFEGQQVALILRERANKPREEAQ
jgi:hypothetical protein